MTTPGFLFLFMFMVCGSPLCAQKDKDIRATAEEKGSRADIFESEISETEKRIEELAKKNKLSPAEKAKLFRKEAEVALARRDPAEINKVIKTMSSAETAVVFFTKEIELNPNPQAYHLRGVAYQRLRRYSDALKDFTVAIGWRDEKTAYPLAYSKAEAYRLRSSVYVKLKDYDKALSDLNLAIKSDPKNVFVYADRCSVLGKTGNLAEAAKDAEVFLNSEKISARDKKMFSESGQCFALVKAGVPVKGCATRDFFEKWGQEMRRRNEPAAFPDSGK